MSVLTSSSRTSVIKTLSDLSSPSVERDWTWSGPCLLTASVTVLERFAQVLVELGDHVERDLLGAGRGALADVGAAAEALVVVLGHHADHPVVPLGLSLRELAEVGDLRTHEQRGRPVGAGCDARAAADARRHVEGPVGG